MPILSISPLLLVLAATFFLPGLFARTAAPADTIWQTKESDTTLPPGCQHISYSSPYLVGKFDTMAHFNIYLPPTYATDTAHLPVIYHLHGSTNNEWTDLPMAYLLDSLIRTDQTKPAIQVWPKITLSGWYYDRDSLDQEESFLIKGLIPYIDSTYRSNGIRAISGFSMGGAAALSFAFKYARQPLFYGVADYDGAFNIPNQPPLFDSLSQSPLKILADSAENVRKSNLLIRSWYESSDFGAYLFRAHTSLDSLLFAKNLRHQFTALTVNHVGVIGNFTANKLAPRKLADPSRVI